MACDLAADPDGRGLLSLIVLHRRAGAAAISLFRGGRRLFRGSEDVGAGVLHSLRDVGDDGASLRRVSRVGRQGEIVGYVAHAIKWTFWPSLAATVLLFAFGNRPGRAAAQHARPSTHLRTGLRARLRHERGALCSAGAALRRPRRRGRDLDLAGVRDRAVVLDRAPPARPARAGVREERGLTQSPSCPAEACHRARQRRDPVAEHDNHPYAAVQPPSIDRLAPVIWAASSLQRNSARAATCSEVTNSLVGCAASSTSLMTCSFVMLRAFMVSGICFSTSGVQTYPGLMQLQVILKVASSSATVLVRPAIPCLADT